MIGLFRCACGWLCYPARALCHRCGGADWTVVDVDEALVEGVTRVEASGVVLGVARAMQVPLVLRLEEGIGVGATVVLRVETDGALWGRRKP